MGYGDFGIPHHKLGDRGDDPETDFGMIGYGVTGWDMGCRTLEFYVNRGADIGCPGGQILATCDNWKGGGKRRKGMD